MQESSFKLFLSLNILILTICSIIYSLKLPMNQLINFPYIIAQVQFSVILF